MDNTESLLLALLRKVLFAENIRFPNQVDWDAVLNEAHAQSVLGIVIQAIPGTVPKEIQSLWKGKDMQRLANYIRYLYAQDQLNELLVKAGIPYAILKGCAAAVGYSRPLMRAMGDIDFIVPQNRFDETRSLLEKNGYVYLHGNEGDRHIAYQKDGYCFELHHHFSHDRPILDQYIDEGLKHTVTGQVEGHAFSMLPPLANGIVLLDHIRTHLHIGLGLRQMIDWMIFVDRNLDDAFWNHTFKEAANKCSLETLAVTATRMGQMYLGLREDLLWCKSADDDLCVRLMDSLLSSGNFGQKNGSGNLVERVLVAFRHVGFFKMLQRSGEKNWNTLKKHPELKPFAWIYQGFRYIRLGLQVNRVKKLKDDVKRSVKRSDLLSDLKLD